MGNFRPVALDIAQPPPAPSPLEMYAKVMQIKAGFLGQQLAAAELTGRNLENQQKQLTVQGQQAVVQAQHDPEWDASDLGGVQKIFNKYSVPMEARKAWYQSAKDYNDLVNSTTKDHMALTQAAHNKLDDLFQVARNAPQGQEQSTYDQVKQLATQYGQTLPPGIKESFLGELAQAPAAYDPDFLDREHAVLRTSQDLNEAALKKAQTAEATGKGAEATAKAAEAQAATTKTNMSDEMLTARAAQGDLLAKSILNFRQSKATQAAGAKAGAEAAAKFPYELQLKQQELAQNPVFAVNPKTNQRELTTVGDAKAQGFTNPIKASQVDVEKETQLNSQLNDLQLNTSRYKAALNAMGNLSKADVANMTRVLSDKSVGGFLTNELTLGAVMDQISQGEKASAWNALSPDKQAALIGSLRMRNSALLFQKVATGMGRASKEALDIELSNMPSPIEGATVGNQKIQAFQENVDQMAARSVKLPWMEQPQDVRARIEGQAVNKYNEQQTAKPQGKYKSASGNAVKVGQNIQLPRIPGLSRVTKVYPDGTFDAQQ